MKMRMFAVLLSFCLLCGAMCGCDYTESTSNTLSTDSTAMDDAETAAATTTVITTTRTTITTTKKALTTTRRTTEKSAETMVWIPMSGSKYHRKSSCSNMKNPSQVTKSYAIEMGYTPCKKCY